LESTTLPAITQHAYDHQDDKRMGTLTIVESLNVHMDKLAKTLAIWSFGRTPARPYPINPFGRFLDQNYRNGDFWVKSYCDLWVIIIAFVFPIVVTLSKMISGWEDETVELEPQLPVFIAALRTASRRE
jgi:hypothetical protein